MRVPLAGRQGLVYGVVRGPGVILLQMTSGSSVRGVCQGRAFWLTELAGVVFGDQ